MKVRRRTDVQELPSGDRREQLRERGQFWTPDWVADAMVAYVLGGRCGAVLDPALGRGAFWRAARRLAGGTKLIGFDIDAQFVREAASVGGDTYAEVRDFVLDPPEDRFSAIAMNPPYVRHHRLTRDTKARLASFGKEFLGFRLDGRVGLHVYFLLRALERLEPGGRLAAILPADVFEGVSANALWQELCGRFRLEAVVAFAPEAAPFPNVDTNALVLLIANQPAREKFFWARCSIPETAVLRRWIEGGFAAAGDGLEAISVRLEDALATGLSRRPGAAPNLPLLGDFAIVRRGIATGANSFFFLTAEQIRHLDLPPAAFIRAVGRTRDVDGEEITPKDLDRLDRAGRPTFLLSLDGGRVPTALKTYLAEGERRGLPGRPLIASRRPWYRMETRVPPPYLFAYLGRRRARFIRNRAGVVPLTGFLCIYPRANSPLSDDQLWDALRNPGTVANLALVGKSYGDGAIKVEPRALERLPLGGLGRVKPTPLQPVLFTGRRR